MKAAGKWLLIGAAGLAAAAAGIEYGRWSRAQRPAKEPIPVGAQSVDAVAQLLSTPLATPDGKTRKLTDWPGKILVVNFWATWCPPCRKEMPEFSRAQDELGPDGVQFVGIAIDEAANVVEFSRKTPVTYPLLIAPANLTGQMPTLGNPQQVLPFTLVIGRDGKVQSAHQGQMDRGDLVKALALPGK